MWILNKRVFESLLVLIICLCCITSLSNAQNQRQRLELQLAGIRLGSPVIDRDENGNLKPNCLLRVWGLPDVIYTPAPFVALEEVRRQILIVIGESSILRRLREIIAGGAIKEELRVIIERIAKEFGSSVSPESIKTVQQIISIHPEALKVLSELDRLISYYENILKELEKRESELQQVVKGVFEWLRIVNYYPSGPMQYVWYYKRGEAVLAFIEESGVVVGIAVAGYSFPYARTSLGDPFRSIQLGDDLQRVLLRYGIPDEIDIVSGDPIFPHASLIGSATKMLRLRYHITSNIEFLVHNNKVVRIFIFLPTLQQSIAEMIREEVRKK